MKELFCCEHAGAREQTLLFVAWVVV